MPSDSGVGKPGVKAIPPQPWAPGMCRDRPRVGTHEGTSPGTLAWGSWQLLAESSCSCGHGVEPGPGAGRSSAVPRGGRRAALAEEGGMNGVEGRSEDTTQTSG